MVFYFEFLPFLAQVVSKYSGLFSASRALYINCVERLKELQASLLAAFSLV